MCGRPARTALVAAAAVLSTALIVCVACSLASVHNAIRDQLVATVGSADIQVMPAGRGRFFGEDVLNGVRSWLEAKDAIPLLNQPLSLAVQRAGPDGAAVTLTASAMGFGVVPELEPMARPLRLVEGRWPRTPDEVVVEETLLEGSNWSDELGPIERLTLSRMNSRGPPPTREPERFVVLGDEVIVLRFLGGPTTVRVVGVVAPQPLGGRYRVYASLEGVRTLARSPGALSQVDVTLRPGFDPAEVATRYADTFGEGVLVKTTAKVTSTLDKNMESSELGFYLALVLSTMSAAFIIMTGLNTTLTEQRREVGILRSVGASRAQVAATQLFAGLFYGVCGAVGGVPLGIGISLLLGLVLREHFTSGIVVPMSGPILGASGAVVAGVIGALWPAWRASVADPLSAIASRAAPVTRANVRATAIAALLLMLFQALVVGLPNDGQFVFWAYATAGLPLMFLGYFLLGVPAVLLVSAVLSSALTRALRLPRGMLNRSMRATPYRFGLTAGALMSGLALMVAITINGTALLRDWLGKLNFPDAFVSGLALTDDSERTVRELPFVRNTCAITVHPVETDAFGVRALQQYRTSFIAFDPRPFFEMSRITWVQGDPAKAIARLEAGGAVIVSREFLLAKGLGVGDKFTCSDFGKQHTFDIVGVVTSPGLEVVSRFFNIGEEFHQQALHAVFGSRRDLRERFGSDATHLIQIDLDDSVNDDEAVARIRKALLGHGVLDAGSGRSVMDQIKAFALGGLLLMSAVAFVAMVIAGFGVANIVVAGIEARRFEFGVLRAVGAPRGLLLRIVAGETLIVALTACVLGTLMGVQGAWAGQKLNRLLLGIDMNLAIPPIELLAAWGIVILVALGAASPAMLRLGRREPRELLSATRG